MTNCTIFFLSFSYWLCDTKEELAELADDEPTNGLFCWDDDDTENVSLYAVYNETMQCTGYHEETHAVTHFLNEPSSGALSEGIAVYMDKTWWGVAIDLCTYLYRLSGNFVSVESLICDKRTTARNFSGLWIAPFPIRLWVPLWVFC